MKSYEEITSGKTAFEIVNDSYDDAADKIRIMEKGRDELERRMNLANAHFGLPSQPLPDLTPYLEYHAKICAYTWLKEALGYA